MKGLAFSSLRVGKKYWAINFGERYEFEIQKVTVSDDFILKDLVTLETYYMSDIIKFGKGNDFEIREIYAN